MGGFGGFDRGGQGDVRFGDGGFFDRSSDAGFGGGGFGSVHDADGFSDRAHTFQQSHPEFQHNASQFQQNRSTEANQSQQNRFNEVNQLQTNRYSNARSLQADRAFAWSQYKGNRGRYYSGLGYGAGFAMGETVAALPVAAAAISVAGNPFWYDNGVYYASQGGQYAVVPPPQGAVVATPPPSCPTIYSGAGTPDLDCGGAFYATAPNGAGYKVIPPPIGSTVNTLPVGAVDRSINGTTYFTFGGAYYRPFYSGSSVIYEVVANPTRMAKPLAMFKTDS